MRTAAALRTLLKGLRTRTARHDDGWWVTSTTRWPFDNLHGQERTREAARRSFYNGLRDLVELYELYGLPRRNRRRAA